MTATRTLAPAAALAALCLALPAPVLADPASKGEAEFLVAPGGGAFEVPIHPAEVCILSFPGEKLASSALTSSPDFEIRAWGVDGIAVRANGKTMSSTLAVASISGAIKVNITLRVVPPKADALALVRFKASTVEDAFSARVKAEVARQLQPLQDELARTKQAVDAVVRDRADRLMADRLLKRVELVQLSSHERNDDNVIVHVDGAAMVGDDGYVFFQIENRSGKPFRIASARVLFHDKPIDGLARMFSASVDPDPAILGVVPPRATARGVVAVRGSNQVRGGDVALEVSDPDRHGAIRVTRGIVLR